MGYSYLFRFGRKEAEHVKRSGSCRTKVFDGVHVISAWCKLWIVVNLFCFEFFPNYCPEFLWSLVSWILKFALYEAWNCTHSSGFLDLRKLLQLLLSDFVHKILKNICSYVDGKLALPPIRLYGGWWLCSYRSPPAVTLTTPHSAAEHEWPLG